MALSDAVGQIAANPDFYLTDGAQHYIPFTISGTYLGGFWAPPTNGGSAISVADGNITVGLTATLDSTVQQWNTVVAGTFLDTITVTLSTS